MVWQLWRAAAAISILPAIAAANSGLIQVTGIRSWSHPDSTRVVLEVTGKAEFKVQRESDPDRLFFDVAHSRPWIERRRSLIHPVNDVLVRRVRIAEATAGRTRIAFDLNAPAWYKVTLLDAPNRMVIEVRPMNRTPLSSPVSSIVSSAASPSIISGNLPARPFVSPALFLPRTKLRLPLPAPNPPQLDAAPLAALYFMEPALTIALAKPPRNRPAKVVAAVIAPAAPTPIVAPPPPANVYDSLPLPSENPSRSLTRALGLKINRVVIDAGHGGHDYGTIGPNGVNEKDVVLDVSLRLATLVQTRLGIEVVLTRSDDTYIPLHGRTAIANDRRADLFLSIHANSSPSPTVAGTETFFLNFTNSSSALDVAARENSGAEKSVGELKDLIQSITLNDKIAESQTFAQTVQAVLAAQAAKANVAAHNRGVKRAPFVVLIGASMPSVLAEIGFLSNEKDEANLGKPDYRQKIAEALYKGVAQYCKSLSHFESGASVSKTSSPD